MRVGCDLVLIERINKLITSQTFLDKIFHLAEITYCNKLANPSNSYAARFAAKEAFTKALGTGIYSEGISPRDVWVTNEINGRPVLNYSEVVKSRLQDLGLSGAEVSLSHQGDYALATVILF